jgi:cysteine desulfurase
MSCYLDYNASAPLRPVAKAAIEAAYALGGNASSVHGAGRVARGLLEDARAVLASCATGFAAGDVVFTSGGTESNALALRGITASAIFVSATEHDSVLKAVPQAVRLPVDSNGVLRLAELEAALAGAAAPALVSVQWANNETGVIQPMAEIATLCRKYKAYLHADAVQALGRVPLAVAVDALTLSAHKVGGPLGVGALLVRAHVPLTALQVGGGQERGRRAGTENVPGICGFAAATKEALEQLPEFAARALWRDTFERQVERAGGLVIGKTAPRVANTSCIALPGFKSELQLMQLDLKGICVSSGSACSSGRVGRSHVLAAMSLAPEITDSALRVSFGWDSSESELIFCAEIWTNLAQSVIKKTPLALGGA